MGISKGSVWGNIKQSVGSAVGYRLKGQNVVRQKPLSYNDANTLQQQKNRAKQAYLVVLYREFRHFVQRQYSGMPETYSDYNSFVSLNHQAVAVDDNLNTSFSPDLSVLSKGSAINVGNVQISKVGSDYHVTWDIAYDSVNSFPNDSVNLCLYSDSRSATVSVKMNATFRSEGTYIFSGADLPEADSVFVSVKNVNNVPSSSSVAYLP